MKNIISAAKRFAVAAPAGGAVSGNIWAGADFAGIYAETAVSGAQVTIAMEGIFRVTKKTGTGQDFAVGEKVYRLATGVGKAAPITGAGTKIPLGFAVAAAATGDTTVDVFVDRW